MIDLARVADVLEDRVVDYYRQSHVSLWVGEFSSAEDADGYFTEEFDPDKEHWKPSPFAEELGLGFYHPAALEVNFEQTTPRPLLNLLMEASFSESFFHAAFAVAREQGIDKAQGIALLYDFDYQLKPNWGRTVGLVRYVGTFPYDRSALKAMYQELAEAAGCSMEALIFVLQAFGEFRRERLEEQGKEGHASAQEFCTFLEKADEETTAEILRLLPARLAGSLPKGKDVATILRDLGLPRSEDVGRVIYGLVNAGLLRKQESDSKADFHGLFDFTLK